MAADDLAELLEAIPAGDGCADPLGGLRYARRLP